MQKKGFALIIFSILLIGLIAAIGMAWTPPTAPPPQETVPAPLNTGPQPQTKQGPLTVKKLEVAPDSDEFFLINRSGATYPLSFRLGTDSAFVLTASNLNILTIKGGKIGILADPPDATLDINGTIKIRGGNPGNNKVLTSDNSGLATWKSPSEIPGLGSSIRVSHYGVGNGHGGYISSDYSNVLNANDWDGAIWAGSGPGPWDPNNALWDYAYDYKTHNYLTVMERLQVVARGEHGLSGNRGMVTCRFSLEYWNGSSWQTLNYHDRTITCKTNNVPGDDDCRANEFYRYEYNLSSLNNLTPIRLKVKIEYAGYSTDGDDGICAVVTAVHSDSADTYLPFTSFGRDNPNY